MIDKLILTPASKKEVEAGAADKIRDMVNNGEFTLSHYAILKRAEMAVKTMLEMSKKEAIRLKEQWSSKEECRVDGVVFTSHFMPPTLDFEKDSEYKRIKDEIDRVSGSLFHDLEARAELLKEAHKLAEKGLKCVTDDGEIVMPPPVLKKGYEVFKATY